MKKYLLAVVVACFATTIATPAFAIKQLNDHFKKVYAGDEANEDFKKLVDEAKCNVCHVARENKKNVRNPYGKALHEALEEAEFPLADFKKDPENEKYTKQLNKILEDVAKMESGDEKYKTFADRMKANLLPGGNTDGKPE